MEVLRNKTIIVAAANAEARHAVGEEFRRAGCQVLTCASSGEAYEFARSHHVDAVLCAARIEGGEPSLLVADVRRMNHGTPVVLFDAAGAAISQTEALHQGFTAYFLSALPTAALAEAIVRGLEFVEERKRKKVERVVVAAHAEITFGDPPRKVSVLVMNLSRGGMFLSVERDFPAVHTLIRFRLKLAKDDLEFAMEGQARVLWVREQQGGGHLPGMGIEFTEITAEAHTFLDRYLERMSRR